MSPLSKALTSQRTPNLFLRRLDVSDSANRFDSLHAVDFVADLFPQITHVRVDAHQMNIGRSFLWAVAVVMLTAAGASAQTTIQTTPNIVSRGSQSERDISDEDLIHSLFDPVTKALNLTPAQKFTIVTIAGASMNSTQPLFDQLDELDDQMSIVAFSGGLNETKLRELSMRQAVVMAEINATIARAKADFYKVMTPEQRAVILAQYKSEQSLGALSNVGP